LKHARRRQADALREIGVGDPAVLLKEPEKLEVDVVDDFHDRVG
jgi:hypothetical protein